MTFSTFPSSSSRRRLAGLSAMLGTFNDFMEQDDLKKMRAVRQWGTHHAGIEHCYAHLDVILKSMLPA